MSFGVSPYDPCPCGSGRKFKFCCGMKSGSGKFPVGTVAYYGPDDKTCTKIVAGVIKSKGAEPILERFVGTNVYGNPKVAEQVKVFFAKHKVGNVVMTDGILGCPHEEGEDFPDGEECPFCPFWRGKQGIARKD
ncbi:MAG: SEC-C metal-binding domain-containing protein [Planctomycetota bacterium]|nr:SEC-C metal-binding domain-containing protein [Planctomycetota bacterium]